MIVDLTKLTQEQQWGIAFATKQFNERKEDKDKLTPQQYADMTISQAADSYYQQLLQYKTNMALAMFQSLTAEQQAALVAQLGVPDVL